MDRVAEPGRLRIGELSRRLGISHHLLRAWERRYGLLRPQRSAGGFRLYSAADLRRVRRMQEHLAQGLSAAEAAGAAIAEERSGLPAAASAAAGRVGPADAVEALTTALEDYDEPAAQMALDRLFTTWTVEAVIRDVLMPYLADLGRRWRAGALSVAQEHFASNLVRERLAGLGRGWGRGHGPLALLACAPGERHDIGLIAFGVVLHRHGWRIAYLGADTPLRDLVRAATSIRPDIVVVAATVRQRFDRVVEGLAALARGTPVAIAGAGASGALADAVGARLLAGDPATAAAELTPPAGAPPGVPGPVPRP